MTELSSTLLTLKMPAFFPLCYSQSCRKNAAGTLSSTSVSRERSGIIDNVVFPTGIDRRDDLGSPDRIDVYYGMADSRIGVARLDLPEILPPGRVADPPKEKV